MIRKILLGAAALALPTGLLAVAGAQAADAAVPAGLVSCTVAGTVTFHVPLIPNSLAATTIAPSTANTTQTTVTAKAAAALGATSLEVSKQLYVGQTVVVGSDANATSTITHVAGTASPFTLTLSPGLSAAVASGGLVAYGATTNYVTNPFTLALAGTSKTASCKGGSGVKEVPATVAVSGSGTGSNSLGSLTSAGGHINPISGSVKYTAPKKGKAIPNSSFSFGPGTQKGVGFTESGGTVTGSYPTTSSASSTVTINAVNGKKCSGIACGLAILKATSLKSFGITGTSVF